MFNGHRVSHWEDENIPEMVGGVVHIAICTFKMFEIVHLCCILFTTITKYWGRGTD